jgi:hypothetical protein
MLGAELRLPSTMEITLELEETLSRCAFQYGFDACHRYESQLIKNERRNINRRL